MIGDRLSVIGGEDRARIEDGGLKIEDACGGFLLHIPERFTPETASVPTAEEVGPWVEAIIRLWDDGTAYRTASERAVARAGMWHADRLGPAYVEFFGRL